jgi:TonB family protein
MSRKASRAELALLAAAALVSLPAHAEWRCDCTKIRGSCHAAVEVKGSWLQVTNDQRACARVDYFVDGQPFTALVVDGEHRQEWLTRTQAPAVLVQSCQVCEDHLLASDAGADEPSSAVQPASASTSSAPKQAAPDAPLIKVTPTYPERAGGRSGEVTVELQVGADGAVTQAHVLESSPRGLFDDAALDAARRWRFPPGAARVVKERIAFAAQATGAAAETAAASASAGPRNACVKEGDVDELVDIIQVQLLDACSAPVVVRTCIEGFAERAGQWVCDEQPVALVARGDPSNGLLGEMATDDGRVRFGYADESYLSRPAGSRYAFIACAVGDRECYGAATRWSEYLTSKPSDVDPRAGSDIEVAVVR